MRKISAVALAAVLALTLAGSVLAKGGGGAWIVLNPTTQLSVSGPHTATFSIYQTKTDEPYVRVSCRVNGVLAYSQLLGYFAGYPYGQTFTFTSNYLDMNYQKLPLYCTGYLEMLNSRGAEQVLATTTFVVQP